MHAGKEAFSESLKSIDNVINDVNILYCAAIIRWSVICNFFKPHIKASQ